MARSAKTDLSVVNVLAGSYVVSDVLAFNDLHAAARIRQLLFHTGAEDAAETGGRRNQIQMLRVAA